MELGQRIRRARLDAGLSQRQLCGEYITRNMLSLIENGSAKPSMDTLRYLSEKLHKPVSYFLEEQAVTSMNQERMAKAREASPEEVLQVLSDYRQPDPVFDRERYLLEALSALSLAQRALEEKNTVLARQYLQKAAASGSCTPYYTPELERKRLLLLFRADPAQAAQIAESLPSLEEEVQLRATALLERKDYTACARLLDAFPAEEPGYHLLRGDCAFAMEQYQTAITHYERVEEALPYVVWPKLENCYRALEDYKMAYEYACKQRGQTHAI